MFVQLHPEAHAGAVAAALQALGLWTRATRPLGAGTPGLLVLPGSAAVDPAQVAAVPGVAAVQAAVSPHPRVDAQAGRAVAAAGLRIGPGAPPVLAAGPCAVESREQVREAAALVAEAGGRLLRGGAYKPRTSPYAFAGLGRDALAWLREAASAEGLGVVTEVLSEEDVAAVADAADLVQVGARNMQNVALLRAVGRCGRPVLLKRGPAASLEEWLLAGEHLLAAGAPGVVFCERGVRGFDPSTRHLLDLGGAALLASVHRLPVLVDPSHAAGRADLVLPLARAALAAGVAGLLVEVHPDPARARSDGPQALGPAAWRVLAEGVRDRAPAAAPAGGGA